MESDRGLTSNNEEGAKDQQRNVDQSAPPNFIDDFKVKKFRKEALVYGIQVSSETLARQDRSSDKRSKESSKLAAESTESGKWLERLTFPPDHKAKVIFNVILVLASLFSTLQATYIACFGFPSSANLQMFMRVVELVFLTDIFLNFFMQYIDESNEYQLQKSIRKIAIRYLTKDFVLDFIAIFPFYYLQKPEKMQTLELLQLLKLLRLRKLLTTMNKSTF